MTDTMVDARVLAAVPLKAGLGRRVVAEARGALHVLADRPGELAVHELAFTADSAVGLARAVMAGDELAMTAPATLRVLAAALLVVGGER